MTKHNIVYIARWEGEYDYGFFKCVNCKATSHRNKQDELKYELTPNEKEPNQHTYVHASEDCDEAIDQIKVALATMIMGLV
jgi:hypothetical protein